MATCEDCGSEVVIEEAAEHNKTMLTHWIYECTALAETYGFISLCDLIFGETEKERE